MADLHPARSKRIVEWAVVEASSADWRDHLVAGPYPSREEAEAHRVAIEMTRNRTDHEHFLESGGITTRGGLFVGWREVTPWTFVSHEGATE